MDTVYLEFTGGFDEHGQPEPLVEIGIPVQISRQVGKDIVDDYVGVKIRPSTKPDSEIPGRIVPGTRIVATRAPGVMDALLGAGYVLTDPPSKQAATQTADHRASRQRRAKNRIEE